LFDVLDTPPAVHVRPAPTCDGTGLSIRGLRVRYGPAEPWALDGLDLDLPPGRRIAVVGPSGSGKSTLVDVLFRFRDPDAGTVTLDGIDLTSREPDDIRAWISGVPQDPHVFAGTVRANLLLPRTDDELESVLRRVGLGGTALDDEVGAHGTRLSGGMRQRLALARALLVDPRILVLDEPTTHLDPRTRDGVLDDLLAATEGRSVILVTHDRARLDRFDGVVEIVAGHVR
jgi:ATP-binding cassette, subfamily C, bacterial CydC